MLVGVFHPVINWCGGAEWVAIKVVNTLKEQGHKVLIMTDQPVDQAKIMKIYGMPLKIDTQIILPLNLFPPGFYHNIYTHMLRAVRLKTKCDILIDTISNGILPKTDITYIHYPFLKRGNIVSKVYNRVYFLPYRALTRGINTNAKVLCANSHFTAQAIKEIIGVTPHILYPPISQSIYERFQARTNQRQDTVITVAHISPVKRLDIIPYIARQTSDNVTFHIIGLIDSPDSIPFLQRIQKIIKQLKLSHRVKIFTDVTRNDLIESMSTSKVYFHPTINEHFGVSIVEAMAAGCIPVVNDSGGPKEFVPEELRYVDIEEAAAKVEKAIYEWSPKYSTQMNGIAQGFSETSFSTRFMKIFNSLDHYP